MKNNVGNANCMGALRSRAAALLLLCFLICAPARLYAQATVLEVVGINSNMHRPLSTPSEFIDFLQQIRTSTGDGANLAYVDIDALSQKQYLHFFLLARAAELGWFYPLIVGKGQNAPYGATPHDCSPSELALQSVNVGAFNHPVWCEHYQWKTAKWIFDILNTPRENDDDWVIKKIFLLEATAGEDLSPLEVYNAIMGQYAALSPQKFAVLPTSPYKSQIDANREQIPYEAWNPWSNKSEEKLRSADLLFFYHQKLSSPRPWGPFADMRDTTTGSNVWIGNKSQYFLGNDLQLMGSFGLDYNSDPKYKPGDAPNYVYAGPFIATNSLLLDSQLMGQKWGLLDYVDFFQPPVLVVNETGSVGGMVIATRSLAVGATILDRPLRIWSKIGEKLYPSTNDCRLDNRVLDYSVKQINVKSNAFIPSLYEAIKTSGCFGNVLDAWKKVFALEVESRPNAILHRLIKVQLNATRLPPYVVTNLDEAVPFFGQSALQRWNVSIGKRLLTQVQLAELSGQRDELGALLRDAEALRGRFLVPPSNEAATELIPIFGQLQATMNTLAGKRLLLRGSSYAEVPELAASMLVGSASSSETWLIPRSLRLLPISPSTTAPKFGRLWADTANPDIGFVRLQFLAELYASTSEQQAAAKLARAHNWKYSGLTTDLVYRSIRRSSSVDWIVEDQVRTDTNKFLFTVRCKQSFLHVLLDQLARPPGLPVEIDWSSLSDSDLNSNSAAPLTTTVGLFSISWDGVESNIENVKNPSEFPVNVVAFDLGGQKLPVSPPLYVDPHQVMAMPSYLKNSLGNNPIIKTESLIDPAGSIDVKRKLDYTANDWSVVPIQIENYVGQFEGAQVKEVKVILSALSPDSSVLYGPIEVSLAAPGLDESRKEIKLFLPAGFKLSYEATLIRKDGSSISGPKGVEQGIRISIN